MTANKELMAQARQALSGKWGLAVGASLVYFIIAAGSQSIPFLGLILGGH